MEVLQKTIKKLNMENILFSFYLHDNGRFIFPVKKDFDTNFLKEKEKILDLLKKSDILKKLDLSKYDIEKTKFYLKRNREVKFNNKFPSLQLRKKFSSLLLVKSFEQEVTEWSNDFFQEKKLFVRLVRKQVHTRKRVHTSKNNLNTIYEQDECKYAIEKTFMKPAFQSLKKPVKHPFPNKGHIAVMLLVSAFAFAILHRYCKLTYGTINPYTIWTQVFPKKHPHNLID